MRLALGIVGLIALGIAPTAFAAEIEVGPMDDLEVAINALQPGDELILQGGMYTFTERFSFSIAGTEAAPIIIRAKDGEQPHIHRPNASENILDVDNAEYVTLKGIEFSGGSAGVRLSAARFLTIEDCEIHDTNDVALRANDGGTYESLRILRNHIHDTHNTGEGMYLGCNSDGCRLANSLIEGNYVHHTNQMPIEQGDGIELKEGSYNNVIRNNVIHDTNFPCILTYSAVGNGEPNIIEGNVMWNCGDHGIQSAADAVIRNNIILSANSDGIAMQPHQAGAPSNLVVVHNTVLHPSGDAISVRSSTGSVVVANNAVYSQSASAILVNGGMGGEVIVANVGAGGLNGPAGGFTPGDIAADFVDGSYGGGPPIDLYPAPGSALIGAGDPMYAVDDDVNCNARPNTAPDVGAYGYEEGPGNPGWTITEDFHSCAADGGSDDGGSSGDGGSDGGSSSADGGPGDGGPDGGNDGTESGPTSGGADGGGEGGDGDGGGCGCRSDVPLSWGFIALGLVALGLGRRR